MGAAGGFGSLGHLAGRFFGALSPVGPPSADGQWALDHLLPGERVLWLRMSGPDRRHAVGVARRTQMLLGGAPPDREVLAGALLHDVGKVESGLGTFARVAVTVAAITVGRDRLVGPARSGRSSAARDRARAYLTHDRIGGELLREAGSDPRTAAWAEEHHLDPHRWSVDRRVGAALKAADDD